MSVFLTNKSHYLHSSSYWSLQYQSFPILLKNMCTYLEYCETHKRLDKKTIKAYRIDLKQFITFFNTTDDIHTLSVTDIESYIKYLHENFNPKTSKRKLASLKAFFNFLEYRYIIETNPFNKIRTKFREPLLLPKTIPLHYKLCSP